MVENNPIEILEYIKAFTPVVASGAAIIASGVAIYGINAWRKEFTGKRKIELAEDLLELFYKAEAAIMQIRNPIGYKGEGKSRKAEETETLDQKQARDKAYVLFERFSKHQELFDKIYAKRFRFMAQIGKDKVAPFDQLHKILMDMNSAAYMLSTLWEKPHKVLSQEEKERRRKEIDQYRKIFWYHGEEDPIIPRIKQTIAELEKICKDVIEGN